MGDQDDGQSQIAVQLVEQRQDFVRRLGIQGAGRLVAQQDAGFAGQGPGDTNSLLLSAGQLCGMLFRMVREAQLLQQVRHTPVDLRLCTALQPQREGYILCDSFCVQQIEMLKNHADPPPRGAQLGRRETGHLTPADSHPPGVRSFQQIDRSDQR